MESTHTVILLRMSLYSSLLCCKVFFLVYIHTKKFIYTHESLYTHTKGSSLVIAKLQSQYFPRLRDKKKMGIIPSDIDSIFMVLGGCGWKGAWAMLKGRNADLIDFSILREFLHHAIFLVVLN